MNFAGNALSAPEPPSGKKTSTTEVLVLGCSLLSLVVSCIVWSSRKQEWVDEIYTWTELNDRSLWHLFYAIQHGADGGMPLFYTTAWVWARIFGTGALALRLYSCLAICGALVILWKTVRHAYGVRATALGMLVVWCTSALILDQNAEARFYGLYLLMVAIAITAYMRLAEQERPEWKVLAGTMLAQAGLVLSHVLGIVYGALILLALISFDAYKRRFRWKVYLAHVAGWLALIIWLPAIRASAAVGRPHGWIQMPTRSDVLAAYDFQIWLPPILWMEDRREGFQHFAANGILLLVAVAMLVVAARMWRLYAKHRLLPLCDIRTALLIVAFSILTTPLVLLVLSHWVTPLFVPRYFLPSGIGLAIVFVAFADTLGVDRIEKIISVPGIAWGSVMGLLVATPILSACIVDDPEINSEYLDVPRLDALIPANVPLVVGWQHDFFKTMRYSQRTDKPYIFLLDWPTALHGEPEFVSDFHLMSNYRQVGYYSAKIKDQVDFLCTHPYFLVLDNQSMSWFAGAVKEISGLEPKVIAAIDEDRELIAVRRTGPLPSCETGIDSTHGQSATAGDGLAVLNDKGKDRRAW